MGIKAILFDFDGVIVESMDIKTQAFYDIYLPYGKDLADRAARYHLENGGVSRYEKFRHYSREFFGKELTEEEVEVLAQDFSDRVMKAVIDAPEVKGVRDYLEANYSKIPMWVITGTPTDEIRQIVNAKGMDKYFVEVLGSPEKKIHWTGYVLSRNHLDPADAVFVGDATTDYEAAVAFGTHFILREHADNLELFRNIEVPRFQDFTTFPDVLNRL